MNDAPVLSNLTYEQHDRVLTVRLDTGGVMNAFTMDVLDDLLVLGAWLAVQPDLAAVIVRGTDEFFTGGMDLQSIRAIETGNEDGAELRQRAGMGARVCDLWANLQMLTIASIEGWCVGAGVALAVSCDLRVMGADATLYVPEVERGIPLTWGAVPRIVALCGPARATRFISLARKVDADQALEWGLADEVVPAGGALAAAERLGVRAAALPPIALRLSNRAIREVAEGRLDTVDDTGDLIRAMASHDHRESIAAFLEHREPRFTGE